MSIQAVNSSSNNPYVNTISNDFQTLQNDVQAYEQAQSTGSSDQVTLSKNALNQAMQQFQSDFASLSQQTQSAQGYHHHHHHGMHAGANEESTGATNGIGAAAAANYSTQAQNNVSTINLTA